MQAFLFGELLLRIMVKHPTEQTECGMKLKPKEKKKAAPGFYFFKYILGTHLHLKSLKPPLLHGFLRRRQCSGKVHILPKEKGHKREKPLFTSAFPRFWNVSSHRKEQFGMWAVTMEITSQGHLFEGAHGPKALNHYGDFRKLGFGSWFRWPSFERTAAYIQSLEERRQGEHMCSLHTHIYTYMHTCTHTPYTPIFLLLALPVLHSIWGKITYKVSNIFLHWFFFFFAKKHYPKIFVKYSKINIQWILHNITSIPILTFFLSLVVFHSLFWDGK